MSDEEKAKESFNKHITEDTCYLRKAKINIYKDGYLDGLTEDRKEKWHDLRKDPNDLPKVSGEYWYKWKDGAYSTAYYFVGNVFGSNIIAWCELPKFEG